MNCPPLSISLNFWVELVGSCNSIKTTNAFVVVCGFTLDQTVVDNLDATSLQLTSCTTHVYHLDPGGSNSYLLMRCNREQYVISIQRDALLCLCETRSSSWFDKASFYVTLAQIITLLSVWRSKYSWNSNTGDLTFHSSPRDVSNKVLKILLG